MTADSRPDDYHNRGVYCGERSHCAEPFPGAVAGTPYQVTDNTTPDAIDLDAAEVRADLLMRLAGNANDTRWDVAADSTRLIAELRETRDDVARLTAEVERLTAQAGQVKETHWATKYDGYDGTDICQWPDEANARHEVAWLAERGETALLVQSRTYVTPWEVVSGE